VRVQLCLGESCQGWDQTKTEGRGPFWEARESLKHMTEGGDRNVRVETGGAFRGLGGQKKKSPDGNNYREEPVVDKQSEK